ncbi:5-formyltetrahydrofolate cyclo-ligase [Gallaecimonas xiamenensis]|uniref:5-formyltetrahydrofolate cyclo-ligase n=1 Tax=Gallaecimonas xiamenensis 3-C-1 TaxID=745411 RepID=K2J4T7_9GAMM|nr:5-formyltetrahydrofolate cyclo-ligase [Gallaecimonas xiamenensis]EKE69932.1 5-formyltetrahydrofolate cyclo-ligase [Gallaecimonas xiamenensis 3-C-1]
MTDRNAIRQWARQQRRALSPQAQAEAAKAVARQAMALPDVRQANSLALYLANDGELDPALLMDSLWQAGKQVLLPVLHPFTPGHLLFLRHRPGSPMVANRFGIPEPPLDIRQLVTLDSVDLVFTPLVAFDDAGHRLGMGGGFYDRTLANYQGPVVGLAHDQQQHPALPAMAWDKPLGLIVTPGQIKRFRT